MQEQKKNKIRIILIFLTVFIFAAAGFGIFRLFKGNGPEDSEGVKTKTSQKEEVFTVRPENSEVTPDSVQIASAETLWEAMHGVTGAAVYAEEARQAQAEAEERARAEAEAKARAEAEAKAQAEAERKAQAEAEAKAQAEAERKAEAEAEARAQAEAERKAQAEAAAAQAQPAEQPQTGSFGGYVDEVVRLVNIERGNAGLGPLAKNNALCQAAAARASELTTLFDHTRPNGTLCFTILEEYGISYTTCAENIAAGQPTPAEVVNGWMNSPGHRANILNADVTEIGIGLVYTEDAYHYYWVQLFRG